MYVRPRRTGKRVLVYGSGGSRPTLGGREHAIAWKLTTSPQVMQIIGAPGKNAGVACEDCCGNSWLLGDVATAVKFAKSNAFDLTVVGAEQPLVAGIADEFAKASLPIFGPAMSAARLEGSKKFAKEFMVRHRIPTAPFRCFNGAEAAEEYIAESRVAVVIKADGLAGGKGVCVPETKQEAQRAAREMLAKHLWVLVEERLSGDEVSFTCVVSSGRYLPLATARDYKQRFSGGRGPMTGGMGVYSPAHITPEVEYRIITEIVEPTLAGLRAEQIAYTGFLYFGIMVVQGAPYLLEYNCRLGDPEAQVILPRLQTDLLYVITCALEGRLGEVTLEWDPRPAVAFVLCHDQYPEKGDYGNVITGLNAVARKHKDVRVFHSGTAIKDQEVVTHGGRILTVVGLGKDIASAREKAARAAAEIEFLGKDLREDIALECVR